MYKKLDDEKLKSLILAGIDEFSEKGLSGANLKNISKNANLSVGVIYKYYKDKNSLFIACVHYSLQILQNLLDDILKNENDFKLCIKKIIHVTIQSSENQNTINKMYNTISSREADAFAVELAKEIEGVSAKVYTDLIKKAQADGKCCINANPALFAFIFDSILMMVQFSYSCDYYKERLKLYCGEEVLTNKQILEDNLVLFVLQAFGINSN